VAPKSEYLRNALQARRAQNTPTPTPFDVQPPPSSSSRSTAVRTPNSSPDSFAEFALTEEQTAPVSPIRRRRPSDAGLPRTKTNRELTSEIEKLKDSLMTSNMRVELLKKSNSELQHSMTKAKERIEQLEPLEEDNFELQEENHHLSLKLEHVEMEVERLTDVNNTIRKSNEELLESNQQLGALSKQNAELWQSQEAALDEAVMHIVKLEEDKSLLTTELKSLKERVAALESASTNMHVDGTSRYPSRMISVDESRPSTSHFDSDYYSQPDSPQAKPASESVTSFAPSERSQKFLDMTEDRRKSARDLVKRMSAASLAALTIRSPSPPPAVPEIPAAFREKQEHFVPNGNSKVIPKVSKRYRQGRHAVSQDLLNEALSSPTRADLKHQQSRMPDADGLRGLYRPERFSRSKIVHNSSCRSSYSSSPIRANSSIAHPIYVAESSPRVPSRASSKHAHTSSSGEHVIRRNPHSRRESDHETRVSSNAIEVEEQRFAANRTPKAPPPVDPTVSTTDLVLVLDPLEDKDRWWRNVEQITNSPLAVQPRIALGQAAPAAPPTMGAHGHARRLRHAPLLESLGTNDRQSRTAPSTPQEEQVFIFNPTENVETFIRKAKSKMSSSRRHP